MISHRHAGIRRAIYLALAAWLPLAAAQPPLLRRIASVELPGPPGKRFDYLTIDYRAGYLLSAHLGAGILYVIDLKSNRLVRAIPGVPGVEGVVAAPELGKVFTSDWFENRIGVVSLARMAVVAKLSTAAKPDGSAYATPFQKVYVSDERGRAEAVVDAVHDRIVKTLHFDSETGMPRYDPAAREIYLNLQDTNRFAVIDPSDDRVIAQYPVGRCQGNHGMALDPRHRLAFLSCEGNDLLTVFDLASHRPIAYLPEAKGADVVKFDPGLGRIYVACYSGAISVFQVGRRGRSFRKLGDVPVQYRVHSLAVDRRTHRVYAPEQEENGRPVARMIVYAAVP